MRRWRLLVVAGVVALGSVAAGLPADAATPVWVRLNASGKAAVVAQPGEIPNWFGTTHVLRAPTGNPSSRGATDYVCPQFTWRPGTTDMGASAYQFGESPDRVLISQMWQYGSTSAAAKAWNALQSGAATCRWSGVKQGKPTYRYVTRVTTLPPLYGRAGLVVFSSNGSNFVDPGSWTYTAYRQLGNAIVATAMSDDGSGKVNPISTLPLEYTATSQVLTDRATARYRSEALQAVM